MAVKAKKATSAKKPAPPVRKPRVKAIPDKYPQVSACLRVGAAHEAIQWYMRVFGAKLRMRLDMPDRRIGHAELTIGKGFFMLSDEFPEMDLVGPVTVGQTCVTMQVYVKNVDATLALAAEAGGRILRPAKDEFYGDRSAMLEDPFGHVWIIQTRVEEVSRAEMKRRLKKQFDAAA